MTIPVTPEPTHGVAIDTDDMEHCCFCRKPTISWTAIEERAPGDQVACCEGCASRGFPSDVPSKRVWMRRERISHSPTFREIDEGSGRTRRPFPDEVAIYPPRMPR